MDLLHYPTLLFTLCILCFILYLSLNSLRNRGNLPPGPTPLPLLGNALDIRGDIVNSLMELRKKYGNVFTVYLGTRPVVVVTGYKLVKEVYVDKGDDFLNRGSLPAWDQFYKNYGLIFTKNIGRWRDLRRFSLSTLRDFGFGKRSTEDLIKEETCYLIAEIRKTKGSFFDPRQCLSRALCNVIFTIMFGDRCEYEDTDITTVLTCIYETFLTASTIWGQIYDMFPGLMKFIPGQHQKIYKSLDRLNQFVNEKVIMNQKTLDPNNPRDFVDAFLIKMEKEKVNPNSEFNMKNLLACTLQIFFAGVETTSTTITYSLLIFLKYPDVLAKVHKEIDQVIGRIRSPSIKDRNHMPYTDAVMHELQRFTDLLPMGVPRKTTKEVEFNGYTLPKDMDVFPLLTTVLKDPTCFKYPKEFNPENFLNEKEEFQKNVAFMPLAAGKRICLGEALVRVELFLFLITILQNFDLKSPIPVEDLDINPNTSGLGNIPKPYKIAFIPR
ncbi:cytochrome P450 2G1-like [Bufo gargarizans]|uniref:cytochrome P450 2G1-like n=1 Tax=Bufo gargarizans TaxID=30331 RepID=UPI001CF2ADFE|nr:cytochrome P450 2G1-like [Bufo gargarizans]